jgi:NAD(P)H-flavin reductase
MNNMIFDKKRLLNHNVVISNHNILNTNLHEIIIQIKNKVDYKSGKYYNIYVNKEKNPYTPISFHKEKNTLQFLIKNYKNNKISESICSVKPKTFIHLEGPFGLHYYDRKSDSIIYKNNPINYENILMFYCGTGITPFYSIITNFIPKTKYNYKLFGSLQNKKEKYFNLKHKIYYSDNKITTRKINKILKSYSSNNTCLFVCGTESYQKLFSNIIKYKIYYW